MAEGGYERVHDWDFDLPGDDDDDDNADETRPFFHLLLRQRLNFRPHKKKKAVFQIFRRCRLFLKNSPLYPAFYQQH